MDFSSKLFLKTHLLLEICRLRMFLMVRGEVFGYPWWWFPWTYFSKSWFFSCVCSNQLFEKHIQGSHHQWGTQNQGEFYPRVSLGTLGFNPRVFLEKKLTPGFLYPRVFFRAEGANFFLEIYPRVLVSRVIFRAEGAKFLGIYNICALKTDFLPQNYRIHTNPGVKNMSDTLG